MTPIMGRSKGRLDHQEKTWKNNRNIIIKSLMDNWPSSMTIGELQKLTHLTRDTLYKHLNELKKSGLVKVESRKLKSRRECAWRLMHSTAHFQQDHIPVDKDWRVIRLPKALEPTKTVFLRLKAVDVEAKLTTPYSAVSRNIISTRAPSPYEGTVSCLIAPYEMNLEYRATSPRGSIQEVQVAGFPVNGDFADFLGLKRWPRPNRQNHPLQVHCPQNFEAQTKRTRGQSQSRTPPRRAQKNISCQLKRSQSSE